MYLNLQSYILAFLGSEYEFTKVDSLCVENHKCDIDNEEECAKAAKSLSSNHFFKGTKILDNYPKGC